MRYHDLQFLQILSLQENCNFQIAVTQTRNTIFDDFFAPCQSWDLQLIKSDLRIFCKFQFNLYLKWYWVKGTNFLIDKSTENLMRYIIYNLIIFMQQFWIPCKISVSVSFIWSWHLYSILQSSQKIILQTDWITNYDQLKMLNLWFLIFVTTA